MNSNRIVIIIGAIALSLALAACGGGGGSSSSGGLGGGVTPATPTPSAIVLTGTVAQLTGPLSSSVWSLPAPGGCPAPTQPTVPCGVYPTPPPLLPTASAQVTAGAAISGATVYVVPANEVDISGIPPTPIAIATTNPSGSFSFSVSPSTLNGATTVGYIVVDGTSVNNDGATNLGYTLAHVVAPISSAPTLLIDRLSNDEESAFTALNDARLTANLPTISSDTIAQAVARLSVSLRPGASSCQDQINDSAVFASFGGIPEPTTAWEDTAGTQWPVVVTYNSPWNTSAHLAGLAALYDAPSCGGGATFGISYYAALYI